MQREAHPLGRGVDIQDASPQALAVAAEAAAAGAAAAMAERESVASAAVRRDLHNRPQHGRLLARMR